MLCVPSVNGVVSARLQVPFAATTAVPRTVLPSLTVTTSPATPVPLKVGLVTLVYPPFGTEPFGVVMTTVPGVDGAEVSINSLIEPATETLPAKSVNVAVTVNVDPDAGAVKRPVNVTLPAAIFAAVKV